jgi:thiol-disulfide isomerase/thioredoxin
MKMSERWVSMSAVALAAALLTFDVGCQQGQAPAVEQGKGPTADACPVDAKPADLSLSIKDMNGADVQLSSFKGKVLLINFWATWCAPCKAEIPGFVELQKKYGKDLQILGVSVDDTPEDIKPYAEKYAINYPLLIGLNREDVEKAYGPFLGIPQSFLISRDGKICVKHPGLVAKDKFEQEIKSLL